VDLRGRDGSDELCFQGFTRMFWWNKYSTVAGCSSVVGGDDGKCQVSQCAHVLCRWDGDGVGIYLIMEECKGLLVRTTGSQWCEGLVWEADGNVCCHVG
jgi:hypothetical protein